MNKYVKGFLQRGIACGGFGPIIAGIVYLILSFTIDNFSLSGVDVFTAIISTYILGFVHAGASVFNQIENWPIAKSLLCHLSCLYVAYLLCYLINSWIEFSIITILIFTVAFILGYFVIWFIVYLCVRNTSKKFNKKLK